MRARGPSLPLPRLGAGFTLVSAIFLMVVLAVLAVSLVSLATVQHITSAQMLQAVRANYAARAGVEWAIAKAIEPAGCVTGPAFTLGGALSAFSVAVTCTRTDHPVGTATPQAYYLVEVVAQAGGYGTPDFVRRQAQAKVLGEVQ
jgi:MSHA biogenesis protein MshP